MNSDDILIKKGRISVVFGNVGIPFFGDCVQTNRKVNRMINNT